MSVTLSHVIANGFTFVDDKKRFFSTKKLGYLNTHLVANSLVQIKPTVSYYNLYLMQENSVETLNTIWKERNKYKYLDTETQFKYGNSNQKPSAVNNKLLKVFMLRNEVALQFLKSNVVILSEREYKDISLIIKPEYFNNFRYEFQYKTIELPISVPQKQVNDLVKVGTQLIQRPVRKIA